MLSQTSAIFTFRAMGFTEARFAASMRDSPGRLVSASIACVT
jgi:hypothetical protein